MSQQIYYVPENASTWTNRGAAGSGYNGKVGGTNRYGTGGTGYPYWGNFTQNDYLCIPSGAAVDTVNYVTWEIGFRRVGTTGRGYQTLWDKAASKFYIAIDESDSSIILYRKCSNGTSWYYYTGSNACQSGHNYLLQIAWHSGLGPYSGEAPTMYIDTDGAGPGELSLTQGGDGTGAWYDDSGETACIGNTSGGGSCPTSAKDYWLYGNIYHYRMWNSEEDLSTSYHLMWWLDRWRYKSFPTGRTGIVHDDWPWSGTTVHNWGSDGSSYDGTAGDNDCASLGSTYTQWVMRDTTDRVAIPSGAFYDDYPIHTFEIMFYYNAEGANTYSRLFSKQNATGEFCISVDGGDDDRIRFWRATTGTTQSWATAVGTVTPGSWYWIGISWDMRPDPNASPAPVVVLNGTNISASIVKEAQGTGDWAYDGNHGGYEGNNYDYAGASHRALNGNLAIFRLRNITQTAAEMIAHYESDIARIGDTEADSSETATMYLQEGTSTGIGSAETDSLAASSENASGMKTPMAETATLAPVEVATLTTAFTRAEVSTLDCDEATEWANSADSAETTLLAPNEEYLADVTEEGVSEVVYILDNE